uniref:Cathepsin L protease inhibitor 1 n=1 Tax=Diaprepes abbreviatus TaxID=13040 RepID=A7LFV2_DIAAB|nr:cathepsin L protease inhibitor 1 [Diaprepes abbreviatus]
MLVKVFLLVVLAAVAMSAPSDTAPKQKSLSVEEHWNNFKTKFNRNYESPEEESKRFEIFKNNLKDIQAHQKKYEAGEVSYQQGVNDFTDLTHEEFLATHTMHFNPKPKS